MKFALVDFWLERITFKLLPKVKPIIVICSFNCRIPEKIMKNFQVVENPSHFEEGKNFIIKTRTDIHKGFLLTFLTHKLNPDLYSHRSEVLQKLLFGYQVSPLTVPDLKFFGKPLQCPKPKVEKVSIKNEILYLNDFDRVYTESLQKYFKIILSTPCKADKAKSARSQLKNIVEGIITSNQKTFGIVYEFSCDVVSDAIFNDLETHDIVALNSLCVDYNESNIKKFFGPHKCREIVPKHRVQEKSQQVGQSQKSEENDQADIENICQQILEDESISNSLTVGEFHYHICTKVSKILQISFFEVENQKNNPVLIEVFRRALEKFFICDDIDFSSIVSDIHSFFGKKLVKLH
jgi:hypothetical protein